MSSTGGDFGIRPAVETGHAHMIYDDLGVVPIAPLFYEYLAEPVVEFGYEVIPLQDA